MTLMASQIVKRTIRLKAISPIRNEAMANSGNILPGNLVYLLSTGLVDNHSVAGGYAPEKAFAVEDELQGNNIDTLYASGAVVQYEIYRSGDEVLVNLASGNTVNEGDKLESNGNGQVRKVVHSSAGLEANQSVLGIALQALTTSSGVSPRLKMRVL